MKIGQKVAVYSRLHKIEKFEGRHKVTTFESKVCQRFEGFYIGWRTYSEGTTTYDEDGPVFRHKGSKKGFLVVVHERKAPVICWPVSTLKVKPYL